MVQRNQWERPGSTVTYFNPDFAFRADGDASDLDAEGGVEHMLLVALTALYTDERETDVRLGVLHVAISVLQRHGAHRVDTPRPSTDSGCAAGSSLVSRAPPCWTSISLSSCKAAAPAHCKRIQLVQQLCSRLHEGIRS